MERLQAEGVRGADLVFACVGPALEIYSRHSKVLDEQDRVIPLGGNPEATQPHQRGFLAYVWEIVGRIALEQILGTQEARARNGVALSAAPGAAQAGAALEEDARLTALFLWTLQSTSSKAEGGRRKAEGEEEDEDSGEEDEEEGAAKGRTGGYSLIFDVARRFAQPLGIHLGDWEGRIIETKKGVVWLLPVKERAQQLFGDEGAQAVADQLEESPKRDVQLALFPDTRDGVAPEIRGRGRRGTARAQVSDESLRARRDLPAAPAAAQAGATTLDRVHAAMLLQAGGRSNALRALLKAEQDRGPGFLRLANALSALYPKDSEEKRLLDAMLLAVPR
jgi:hypothetical protein